MSEQTQAVRRQRRLRHFGVLAAVVVLVYLPGCVQRRMTIRSNPPGALVYVDNHEIGVTPISTSFLYYGTREIRLVKDGYETLTVLQPMLPPWYQIPPLDFFSENLVPGEFRDQRIFTYQLQPQMVVPTEQLIDRAQQLRSAAQSPGGVMGASVPRLPSSAPMVGFDGSLPAAAPSPSPLSPNGMPH